VRRRGTEIIVRLRELQKVMTVMTVPKVRDGSATKDPSSASRSGCSSRGVAAQRAAGDLDSRTMGVAPMVRAVSSGGDTAARSAFLQVQRRSCV
jgi:hypothetical protein